MHELHARANEDLETCTAKNESGRTSVRPLCEIEAISRKLTSIVRPQYEACAIYDAFVFFFGAFFFFVAMVVFLDV